MKIKSYRIDAWGDRGYFSVVEEVPGGVSDIRIAVCVYKKGAVEVKRRLDELEAAVEKLTRGE